MFWGGSRNNHGSTPQRGKKWSHIIRRYVSQASLSQETRSVFVGRDCANPQRPPALLNSRTRKRILWNRGRHTHSSNTKDAAQASTALQHVTGNLSKHWSQTCCAGRIAFDNSHPRLVFLGWVVLFGISFFLPPNPFAFMLCPFLEHFS